MSQPIAASFVGESLKKARLKKGDSIEEASNRTRIPKKYLQAIESGRPDELPALVYFEGFLKIYCDYLGVSLELLRQTSLEPLPTVLLTPQPHKQAHAETKHAAVGHSSSHYGLVMAACIVVLAGASFLFWHVSSMLNGAAVSTPPTTPVSLTAPALQALVENGQYREDLTIIFHDDVWIRVLVDGKSVFKGGVSHGQMQEWKARKSIILETGSPRAFDLMLNGAPYALSPNAAQRYVIRVP